MKAQTDFPRLTLRLPKALLVKIKKAANDGERSINNEVIARLSDSFSSTGKVKTPEIIVDGCQVNTDTLAAKIAEKIKFIKEQQEQRASAPKK